MHELKRQAGRITGSFSQLVNNCQKKQKRINHILRTTLALLGNKEKTNQEKKNKNTEEITSYKKTAV